MPALPPDAAYVLATTLSLVVERKPYSQPPRTFCSSGIQKLFGSTPPVRPLKTFSAFCSFDSLTTAEFITWIVVVYLLPPHSSIHFFSMKPLMPQPRRTALYLR